MTSFIKYTVSLTTPLFIWLSTIIAHEFATGRKIEGLAVLALVVATFAILHLPLFSLALAGSKRTTDGTIGSYRYWLLAWPLITAGPAALFFTYHVLRDLAAGRPAFADLGFAFTVNAGFAAYGLVCGLLYCLIGELVRIRRASLSAPIGNGPLTSRA
jgi:hypothetical protein